MSILIGSYKQGIYNLEIENNKLKLIGQVSDAKKASYLMDINDNLSYIHTIDDLQYINIENQDVLLTEGACHLSYDNKNDLIYTSFYGAGLLKVLKKDSNWEIIQEISYGEKSHVHYASYIDTIDLVGVCDLGLNTFTLYSVDDELKFNSSYTFDSNAGPRHFVFHKEKPLIYIINELISSVSVLRYENNTLTLIQDVRLKDGAGSAIRIDKENNYLYTAVRFSNLLYSLKIEKNGLLEIIQEIQVDGDHPRDFNLVNNEKHLLVANMNSDNLTLFSIDNGILTKVESDFYLEAGASIINYR